MRRQRFKHYAAGVYLVAGLIILAGAAGASDLAPDKPIPWGMVLLGIALLFLALQAEKVSERREWKQMQEFTRDRKALRRAVRH